MTQQWLVGAVALACLIVAPPRFAATQPFSRLLSCEGPFRPDASAASLAQRFGARNVVSADLDLGEGFTEAGTIVFEASPMDRMEVLWFDPDAGRRPRRVTVREPSASRPTSHWRTPGGLALGTHLREVERLNRRPFRLSGFGWDYGGTAISWAGGSLDMGQRSPCRIRARFETGELLTEERQRWDRQISGDREFSSGHAAMQALDPYVYEIWLDYQTAG
jgi:hypothetical protein